MTKLNNTPSATHTTLLANLTDADLLAPLPDPGSPPAEPVGAAPAQAFGVQHDIPNLLDILVMAWAVPEAETTADLASRLPRPGAVGSTEDVSSTFRVNGFRISEALRAAIAEHIKTPNDLEYTLRALAVHGLNSLIGHQHQTLAAKERAIAAAMHDGRADQVKVAALGEVAATHAAAHLTETEFKFLLELVDSDRATMAQNLAGPKVDVPALAAGRGLDWRKLAHEWAEACSTRGYVVFEGTGTTTTGTSYSIEVGPGAGWVLSKYVDQLWIPIEASPAGASQAAETRRQCFAIRSQSAKPAPFLGGDFPDTLGAV